MGPSPRSHPQGQETIPDGGRFAFSPRVRRRRPAVDARKEPEQRSRGPERPVGGVPGGPKVPHLERICDAPVLGPPANVGWVADDGLRCVHGTMLHPACRGRGFGLSWRQTRAGVAELADARDLKSRDSPRVVRVRSPPPASRIKHLAEAGLHQESLVSGQRVRVRPAQKVREAGRGVLRPVSVREVRQRRLASHPQQRAAWQRQCPWAVVASQSQEMPTCKGRSQRPC
jgi:hypothetical protein